MSHFKCRNYYYPCVSYVHVAAIYFYKLMSWFQVQPGSDMVNRGPYGIHTVISQRCCLTGYDYLRIP